MKILNYANYTGNNYTHNSQTNEKISNAKHQTEKNTKADQNIFNDFDNNANFVKKELKNIDLKTEYSIHKETGHIILKIYDPIKNKLIKEIPSEKLLDIITGIIEKAGLILDERV